MSQEQSWIHPTQAGLHYHPGRSNTMTNIRYRTELFTAHTLNTSIQRLAAHAEMMKAQKLPLIDRVWAKLIAFTN